MAKLVVYNSPEIIVPEIASEIKFQGESDPTAQAISGRQQTSPRRFGLASDLVVDGGWAGNRIVDAVRADGTAITEFVV